MGKGLFPYPLSQDSSSVSGHAADFRAGRAMGHAMDGTSAPRGGEYREPVSGTNGIYALYHTPLAA
jgi:hypothetical protein